MSDLSMYELEDIIWDDFKRSGDHIVPHPTHGHDTEDKCEGDSYKKPRQEVTPPQRNEERNLMEEDSWSNIHDGVFAASGDTDSEKAMSSLQSGDTKVSNYCFKSSNITSGGKLCTDEGILKGTIGAVDSNSYNHPQSHARQSDDDDDLNLFSNDGDDKESNDLLYYGWPDIRNFEDMDKMLSNCDSSFGLGVTSNDDELVWFTSEDPAGGYEEVLKTDLKFPCSGPSGLTNVSQDYEPRGSENTRSSFETESKDEFKFKDQVLQKKQSRQQNETEGNVAGQSSGSFGLKRNEIPLSSSEESAQDFTSIENRQKNKISGHDSFGYTQSSAYLHSMQTTSGSMITDIKSESNICFMESSCDPVFQGTVSEISGKNKVHHAHAFQPSFSGNQSQSGMMLQQLCTSENKVEGQSDVEGVKKGISAELGLLDVPEGSSISSELDEISLEATSFRQLQQVMEQLDLRTKLCIRDSLYRLARSAEQRHNYRGISESTANYGGTSGSLMTEGTSKYAGLMDMETDTNPIDRTIAHLLFHRPPDSNNRHTSLPIRPNAKVSGSTIGQPMVTEKLSCQKGENESNDKISSSGKN